MKKVAIIGTVGVPANYGGYETLVENLLDKRITPDITYQVYCSSKAYPQKRTCYKGAKLIYLPLKANGWQSVFYDSLSLVHAYLTADVILSLGTVGCFILPFFRILSRKKIIVNLDGLDNEREKFNTLSQRMISSARKMASKYADICIADNQGIVDYAKRVYDRDTLLIEYGGDNACPVNDDEKLLKKYGLEKFSYFFKVARIEPENNIEMILEAFSKMPYHKLVMVGNWERGDFGKSMQEKYSGIENILMLDPIYEPKEINLLRSNCKLYIHGHSAGGTNPFLVEAMNLGLPILSYDVVYNRETTENKALYFSDEQTLKEAVKTITDEQLENTSAAMKDIAKRRYTWSRICRKYEELF